LELWPYSLSKEEIKEIEGAVPVSEVAGERYHEDIGLKESWRYSKTPPLSSWKAPRWHRGPQQNKCLLFCFQKAKVLQKHRA
jgi:hypothetical protein